MHQTRSDVLADPTRRHTVPGTCSTNLDSRRTALVSWTASMTRPGNLCSWLAEVDTSG